MRTLFLFALPLLALDNATRFTPVASVTAAPQSFRKHFIDGEIPAGKFPAPYVSGTILSTWQVDQVQRYPSGAVEHAIVSFPLTASALTAVEYRPHDNPCSAGNQAACDAAALDQAGMLAFNGGTWAASITLTANPQGSTTARTFDARAVLNAGRWRYRLRGPAVTQVIVGDTSTSRLDDFGWAEHRVKMLTTQIDNASGTSVVLNDATGWASIPRPFEISVGSGVNGGYERISICYVSGNTLTVGTTNGASSACATTAGRNLGGTAYTYHTISTYGTYVFLRDGAPVLTQDLWNLGIAPSGKDLGTTDDYVATISPAITVPYVNDTVAVFRANTANTGAATLTLNGGATAPLTTSGGSTLADNAVKAGDFVYVQYKTSTTNWRVMHSDAHPSYTGRILVDDGSAFSSVKRIQVGAEEIRICDRDSDFPELLTFGTGAWGCAPDTEGRSWHGTNIGWGNGSYFWTAGVPARILDGLTERWVDAPTDQFKSIHPEAVLTFPAGWAGVGVRFGTEIGVWTDRMQDQYFDVSVSVGGSTVATKTAVKGAARTQLLFPVQSHALQSYWSGSTPGEVRLDHNLKHCFAAGVCLQDPDLPVTTGTINSMLSSIYQSQVGQAPAWTSANNDNCEADTFSVLEATYRPFFGFSVRTMNTPGGRDELGPIQRPSAMWLYSWAIADANSSAVSAMVRAQPACQAKIPYKYREHNNSRAFCDGWSYAANTNDKACSGANLSATTFGRPPSVVAYPGIGPQNQNLTRDSADYRRPVGVATANGFLVTVSGSRSHNPALAYWPALFSGDYFDDDIAMHQGYVAMVQGNDYINWTPSNNTGGSRGRERGPWAWPNADDGIRKPAWIRRDAYMGWKIAPVGSPEKQLLESYLKRLAAMWEGMYDIQDGLYYSACPGDVDTTRAYNHSPWCWGRAWPGFQSPTANFPSEPGIGYQTTVTSSGPGSMRTDRGYGFTSAFMVGYDLAACAQMVRGGAWMFEPLCRKYGGGWIVRRSAAPGSRPWLLANYQVPDRPCIPEGEDVPSCNVTNTIGRAQGFTSLANWQAAFNSGYTTNYSVMDNASDLQSGYALITSQVAKLYAGINDTSSVTGRRAWDWWKQNIKLQNTWPTNPHWIFGVRVTPVITVTPGDTAARVTSSTFYNTCKVGISSSAWASHDDSGDTTATMIGQRVDHVLTGLTPATAYNIRVSCGDVVRTFGTFTTAASSSASATVAVQLKAPSGRSIDNVLLEWGSTTGLGSSTTASCSASCTLNATGTVGEQIYLRYTYRTAANATVAQSPIFSRIAK